MRDEATLQARVTALLTQYQVTELLRPEWAAVEERHTRYVGRGRGSAQRATEERVQVHYRITRVVRVTSAITAAQQELGWALQISNAPVERLTLAQATQAYCGGWRLEHTFHQFKDRPVGVSPLFVWRNAQICLVITHISPQSTLRPQRDTERSFSARFAPSAVNGYDAMMPSFQLVGNHQSARLDEIEVMRIIMPVNPR